MTCCVAADRRDCLTIHHVVRSLSHADEDVVHREAVVLAAGLYVAAVLSPSPGDSPERGGDAQPSAHLSLQEWLAERDYELPPVPEGSERGPVLVRPLLIEAAHPST